MPPGTYTLTVVAISSDGEVVAEGSSSVVIPEFGLARTTVSLAHTAEGYPMLVANGPSTGWVNQTLTFGGLATDHGGAITSYVWDFGDASPPVFDTTVATTSHVYGQAGTFVARLTATDNDGLTATAEVEVTIQDESLEFLRFEDSSDHPVPPGSVEGQVIIVAEVRSAQPVSAVEFLIDGRLLARATSAGALFAQAYDSRVDEPGEHTLLLRAQTVGGVLLQSQIQFTSINPRLRLTLPDGSDGRLLFRTDQDPPQTVRITNAGGGELQWAAATDAAWCQLTTAGDQVTVQVNWSQLAPATHTGSLVITSNGGNRSIPVVAFVRELEVSVN
jgi:PKD repeat protein